MIPRWQTRYGNFNLMDLSEQQLELNIYTPKRYQFVIFPDQCDLEYADEWFASSQTAGELLDAVEQCIGGIAAHKDQRESLDALRAAYEQHGATWEFQRAWYKHIRAERAAASAKIMMEAELELLPVWETVDAIDHVYEGYSSKWSGRVWTLQRMVGPRRENNAL
jgi:hypothetical protein